MREKKQDVLSAVDVYIEYVWDVNTVNTQQNEMFTLKIFKEYHVSYISQGDLSQIYDHWSEVCLPGFQFFVSLFYMVQ